MSDRPTLQPLDSFTRDARRGIRGVFTDIDDTLTTDGRLTAEAFSAMHDLHKAGFLVIPITGRPAGWCDHFARMWPVDAVVGENGAFYFRYDRTKHKMTYRFDQPDAERAENRRRLAALSERILDGVPGCAIASDQPYRETDLAIDFCEDVPRLPIAAVDRIVDLFEEAGATAKISSIHVNGWYGTFDKLTMARHLMAEIFDTDLEENRGAFVFVGDAPNDSPMFGFFDHAVGVANVMDFRDHLDAEPAYITTRRGGAGFAEVAAALIAAKD